MSHENQELTEHTEQHKRPVKGCEFCQVDTEIKIQVRAWDIIQKAIAEM